jgi:anthranilate phosphoribosyltransferase
MDEISIAAPTEVAELKDGTIRCYQIAPEDFGIVRGDPTALKVADAHESLAIIQRVLAGEPGPARDIVVLNAGAAIYAADLVDSLAAGIAKAATVIDSGVAREKLAALVRVSNSV